MSHNSPRVGGIDHVELVVPNRDEAVQWYRETLGFSRCDEFDDWAEDGGPVMISSDGGTTKLAVFEGSVQRNGTPYRIAFRTDGAKFLCLLEELHTLSLSDEHGQSVTRSDVVDHGLAYSLYVSDPYGTRLEITTYDYDVVDSAVSGER